ncbi:hypothetical protein VE02_07277 [Pseudogymnoascus sp. 03VT05]|nr:hypothetical protein VE02_07277 [Pseudogymnoascus sp. 03VT05]
MHASARVLDARAGPTAADQQSAIKQSNKSTMSLLTLPGQLHIDDPHHLHHLRNFNFNFTFTSTFCILDTLCTCLRWRRASLHYDSSRSTGGIAPISVPPLNPNAPQQQPCSLLLF